MNNREFSLPSDFLNDDETLMGKKNLHRRAINSAFSTNFGFSTEFPYDFGSYGSSLLSSPVESVVGSTETESEEDELLAGLTRQFARSSLNQNAQKITSAHPNLEKSWVMSGSPQSTLSAVGSWPVNSAFSSPSPPATPFGGNNDGWDLIYAAVAAGQAAGQAARFKMNCEGTPKGRGLLSSHQILSPIQHSSQPVKYPNPNTGFYSNQSLSHNLSQANHIPNFGQEEMLKQQCSSIWGRQMPVKQQGYQSNGGYERQLGYSESAWPPVQIQRPNHLNQPPQQRGGSGMRAVFLSGSGVKRECAGTGVFLPRGYGGNNPSECRKKSGCSTALLPARVFQALNNNFDNMASQSQAQSRFNNAFVPEYDNIMARRNAMMLNRQQMWSLRSEGGRMRSQDLCQLPQEWTY